MELQIRTNGVKVTDGMREFIDRRMTKLDKLAVHVIDAQLELKTEASRRGEHEVTTAQITLHTGKRILRAEAEDVEVARAIDQAIDKLIRQVRKYSDKRTNKKRRPPTNELVAPVLPLEGAPDSGELAASEETLPDDVNFDEAVRDMDVFSQPISRTKTFQMEPMGVETAIEQMELVGHDFFFFKNDEDEKFSVLYRRRDGSYGILSPE